MNSPDRDRKSTPETPAVNASEATGNVIPLRAREHSAVNAAEIALEPRVYEAEILTPEENAELDRRRSATTLERRPPNWLVRLVRESEHAKQIRTVVVYRVRKAPTDAVRLSWFAVRGHGRWLRKLWEFFTYADLRSDARQARVAGDTEARRTAQELIRSDARARWAKVAIVLRRLVITAAVVGGLLSVLALAESFVDRTAMWSWLATVLDVRDAVFAVLGVVWSWLVILGPIGVLFAAIWEGRDRTPGAGFLVRPDRDSADSWIDERMISTGLANLGIAPLDKFFKTGGQLVYTVPARMDGDGTYAQIRLPMGVTADMVADRRDRLAANLGRAKLETWPTEGTEAGMLDLWVADKGKLGGGAGPWPLLADGECDVFTGVPWGRSQRGDVLTAPLMERNWIIGGIPGQGKSAAARTLMLGAALDPTCELWVFVFASNPDFDPFAPRLSRYVKGDDDEAVEAGLAALRRLREEVTERGKLLEQHGASKVNRKLADRVPRLRPLVVLFDEVHELFEHPQYGKEAGELAVKVIKKGRKTGVTLTFATQSPTATSIPKDVTRNCSNGVAFAVGDFIANDGLLGTGKYRAGIRATDLRPGEDRGTAVTVGLTTNRFELVRTFYVQYDEHGDQVTPVIVRAMALLAEHGRTVPAEQANEPAPVVDHLADIAIVIAGEKRVRTQVVLSRLADRNPAAYEGWTFPHLKAALAEYGVSPVKSDGVMVVRADDITRALTERDEED
jgi:DNA segregation ATPase FtsK/SpoIIIE, S-DNA-T family